MRISKDHSILLSKCCIVLFAAALLALDCAGYPVARWFCRLKDLNQTALIIITAVLYFCSVFAWIALCNLWKLLCNIQRGEVFAQRNVRSLRAVSWCCVGVGAACIAVWFYYVSFVLISVAAGFMALIVRIVKNVFEQAIEMKSELDLTI